MQIERNQAPEAYTDVQCAQASAMQPVLLLTALVEIADSVGKYKTARAILDNGSERCVITLSLRVKLNTQCIQSTQKIKGI